MSLIRMKHSARPNFLDILKTSMIALNDEYIYEMATAGLREGDEVAVIPPISGG
jgi:molybdopterin converting factor small subunit